MVGTLPKSKSPDASQGPALEGCKDISLGTVSCFSYNANHLCYHANEACRNQGIDSGVLDPVVHVKKTRAGTLFGKPEYAWIVT